MTPQQEQAIRTRVDQMFAAAEPRTIPTPPPSSKPSKQFEALAEDFQASLDRHKRQFDSFVRNSQA